MAETRYIETYDYTGVPPEERTPDKAKITRTSYVVSNEELAEESKKQRKLNILAEIDDLKARIEKLEKK